MGQFLFFFFLSNFALLSLRWVSVEKFINKNKQDTKNIEIQEKDCKKWTEALE